MGLLHASVLCTGGHVGRQVFTQVVRAGLDHLGRIAWLVVFARHRRIAYAGDWLRAVRRGAWVGLFVAILVVLRLVDAFQLPIVLFLAAIFVVAEVTLSAER